MNNVINIEDVRARRRIDAFMEIYITKLQDRLDY